jgi:hypothetical protein
MTCVGTAITGEGLVIFKDVTVHGLHRMCVEQLDKYPDVEVWSELLAFSGWRLALHDYRERLVSGVVVCHLWIFWKE